MLLLSALNTGAELQPRPEEVITTPTEVTTSGKNRNIYLSIKLDQKTINATL